MNKNNELPWEQPDWMMEARDWSSAALARQADRLTGPMAEVKIRPWSAVFQLPTRDNGAVFFKTVPAQLRHEVNVTTALSEWRPDCILPVLAADPARGWLLLPDGGPMLRKIIRESGDYRHWYPILPLYAGFQIEMAGRVPELLAMGMPDRRLAVLPAQFEALLEDRETLRIGQEEGLSPDEYGRLQTLVPEFAEMCQELAGYNIPETVNHGDFHDGNILAPDGRYLIFDWGDSAISHPFYSLRSTLVSLYFSLDIDEGAPEHDILRDKYLALWRDFESWDRLLAAFKLAQQIAAVNGALVWHNIVSRLEGPAREEYAGPVPRLLQEFLELEGK